MTGGMNKKWIKQAMQAFLQKQCQSETCRLFETTVQSHIKTCKPYFMLNWYLLLHSLNFGWNFSFILLILALESKFVIHQMMLRIKRQETANCREYISADVSHQILDNVMETAHQVIDCWLMKSCHGLRCGKCCQEQEEKSRQTNFLSKHHL